MASTLPPAGSGYSGRAASSNRYSTKSTAAKSPATSRSATSRSAATGRFVSKPPKGSAGVSRAK